MLTRSDPLGKAGIVKCTVDADRINRNFIHSNNFTAVTCVGVYDMPFARFLLRFPVTVNLPRVGR